MLTRTARLNGLRASDVGIISDACLAAPITVEALVKAAKSDDAVARALLLERNPVLMEEIETHEREASLRAIRRAVLAVAGARGSTLTAAQRERIASCGDVVQLETWHSRLATGSTTDAVFD